MYSHVTNINCFLIVFIVCSTFCGAAYLPSTTVLEDSGNLNFNPDSPFPLTRSKRSTCPANTVSLLSEIDDLGQDERTVCPFETKPKFVELEHSAGTVIVEFNQIVCSGACTNNCGAGKSCKQLKTKLQVKIVNPGTGFTEEKHFVYVNVGCSCTPDDAGSPGETISK